MDAGERTINQCRLSVSDASIHLCCSLSRAKPTAAADERETCWFPRRLHRFLSVICHLSSWPVSRLRISLLCLDRYYWQQYGRPALRPCFCISLTLTPPLPPFLPLHN